MACRRSSSGKYSQDSRRWASSKRFKKYDEKYTAWTWAFQEQNHPLYNDIAWEKRKKQRNAFRILLKLRSTLVGFLAVVGHSWDLDQKRNGARLVLTNQTEIGTELQKWYSNYIQNLVTNISCIHCFGKRRFTKQRTWQTSTQFNDNEGKIELLLRTVMSVNELSIYGAMADLCKELNENSAEDSYEDSESSGTRDTEEGPNEMEIFFAEN